MLRATTDGRDSSNVPDRPRARRQRAFRLPQQHHGLYSLQAAGSRRPRDADLHKSNENANTVRRQDKPSKDASGGAGPDIYENREPAARAALDTKVTRTKDAGRSAAQLPDGRKRLGRDAAHSQTRHAYVFRLRRL